jgi:hypothetical protein
LKWARRGPARAGRGLRRLKTRVGERVPRPEARGRGSKFGRSHDDVAGIVISGEQALGMLSRICDLAEDPEIGAERKGKWPGPLINWCAARPVGMRRS